MTNPSLAPQLDQYRLEDRYRRSEGRVFMSGTQALVRLALEQAALDRRDGRNTAGFITGYRGSPLGAYDQALWAARSFLEEKRIEFMPAINEDLAATAIIGTQQVEGDPAREVDGVFAIWYGKGPGVDRAGDAMKHGNAYGSSPNGGVLVIAGDDHGCVSSSMSHQSDVAFMSWFMPTLHPASVAEYIAFGLYGFALSRFSGTWVGFKAISEVVESTASIELRGQPRFQMPRDFDPPPSGLHYRWPDFPGPQVEARMVAKVDAVRAFARANPIDRRIYDIPTARFGIITTGKAHHDLMEALRLLGIDERRARQIGIDIYKIGMVWPIETEGARAFLRGKEEVLVVEEKRGIIESELKEFLYDYPGDKPRRMVGKYDESGATLVPWVGELSPGLLAPIVARRIVHEFPELDFSGELARIEARAARVEPLQGVKRLPYFCSGCPHNTSTRVPEGSHAQAGIGCHFMASWMNRSTESLIQMGGEGVNWAGKSRFTGRGHIFQNLGEGTYFHSGYMAIRQAIAAGANITYKILFNDAVAMTGGQPVDGRITVPAIASQLRAEGVQRIAVVSDEPHKYDRGEFPRQTSFHDRRELDGLQRELREVPGVSALIYDQQCAAEKRRGRKRGSLPDPARRVFINELVCEGCGDCSVQSNCLSVYPVETQFGRKRRIEQHSCNKDFSCLQGFCPSFVSVEGGRLRRPAALTEGLSEALIDGLPEPELPQLRPGWDLLVAGVGGTGVVTIGAVLAMAAHLEGKGASVLDFMGFAQKGGAVLSYLRFAADPDVLNQPRIDSGAADAVIVCDLVVGTDPRALGVLRTGHTRILASSFETPSGDFVLARDADFASSRRLDLLADAVGEDKLRSLDAGLLAERLLGDTVYSNMLLLGCAWQAGMVPVSRAAIRRAIELNARAVGANLRAFEFGRLAAADPDTLARLAAIENATDAQQQATTRRERYEAYLRDYQDADWAASWRRFVEGVDERERSAGIAGGELGEAVARNLFRLMSYKDEYEVARLYTSGEFAARIADEFEGDYRLKLHLAPPFMPAAPDAAGRPAKREFGAWMLRLMRLLRHGKGLRGSLLDPFGWQAERRQERALIGEYRAGIEEVLASLDAHNHALALCIARLPEEVRGFGPVKQAAVVAMRRERERLFAEFRNTNLTASNSTHASGVAIG